MYSWFNPLQRFDDPSAARGMFVLPLLPPVVGLGLGRRDVADGLEQSMVVEPRDPLQCRQLDGLARLPRCPAVDQLGVVQPLIVSASALERAVNCAAWRR